MGIRELAARDNRAILNDDAAGFAWPIELIDPATGQSAQLKGPSKTGGVII